MTKNMVAYANEDLFLDRAAKINECICCRVERIEIMYLWYVHIKWRVWFSFYLLLCKCLQIVNTVFSFVISLKMSVYFFLSRPPCHVTMIKTRKNKTTNTKFDNTCFKKKKKKLNNYSKQILLFRHERWFFFFFFCVSFKNCVTFPYLAKHTPAIFTS